MLAITNAKILTITNGTIQNGSILIENGKIMGIGSNIDIPAIADVYDASGCCVMPGLIDAHCHTGLFADGIGWSHSDGNEMTEPITPQLRAIDAIHPEDIAFDDLRQAGITTINTGPGSANLIGGQFACIKTKKDKTIDEMVIMAPSAMKMALGENPKNVYGDQDKAPSTRMANAAVLRTALINAQTYMEKLERYDEKFAEFNIDYAKWEKTPKDDREDKPEKPDPVERHLKNEALIPVLQGELRAMIHCHRADDIITAIRIAEEFNLNFSIEHCTEGYRIADKLAEKDIPCVVGPVLFSRTKYELRNMTPTNPGILSNAGVKVAIQTDEMSAVQYMLINAALAVQKGMNEEKALEAITITPAEIIGISKRVGSLETGKDADILILSGEPLDYRSHTKLVLIEGVEQFRR